MNKYFEQWKIDNPNLGTQLVEATAVVEKGKRKCSQCKQYGHNKRTCKAHISDSEHEEIQKPKKKRRCSLCHNFGHNKRTCAKRRCIVAFRARRSAGMPLYPDQHNHEPFDIRAAGIDTQAGAV